MEIFSAYGSKKNTEQTSVLSYILTNETRPCGYANALADYYKGIFPCFFFGLLSTFVSSISSARMRRKRVSCGSMTSSR